MFVDRVTVEVSAGRGGDGAVSFLREAHRPRGGPDGGDGGDGGSVVLAVATGRSTLRDVAKRRRYAAAAGKSGQGKNRTGRSARDLVVEVPPGTLVIDDATDALVADLTEPGERFVLARGGAGGKGNAAFATALNQAPRTATRGEPGEEGRYRLELKLIAAVGLVGLPNAGKSTLLSRVTRAEPRVAAYPFTTLTPHLGVATVDGEELVLADIPGLTEGASAGKGLGDDFLRHVERTKVLLHLVDGAGPEAGGLEPADAYRTIRSELESYRSADLAGKPEVVALNKVDALPPEVAGERADALAAAAGCDVLRMSGVSGEGTDAVLRRVQETLAVAETEPEDGSP